MLISKSIAQVLRFQKQPFFVGLTPLAYEQVLESTSSTYHIYKNYLYRHVIPPVLLQQNSQIIANRTVRILTELPTTKNSLEM